MATTALVRTFAEPAKASHQWSDVGTGNFFHDEIGWLVDNGIANGFTATGTFKPTENILRQQAALWFANYNDSLELVTQQFDPPDQKAGFNGILPCPTGKRPIAGGGHTTTGLMYIRSSYPDTDSWVVEWRTDGEVLVDSSFAQVWALCAPET